jgi:hypothetical protein
MLSNKYSLAKYMRETANTRIWNASDSFHSRGASPLTSRCMSSVPQELFSPLTSEEVCLVLSINSALFHLPYILPPPLPHASIVCLFQSIFTYTPRSFCTQKCTPSHRSSPSPPSRPSPRPCITSRTVTTITPSPQATPL